MSTEKQSNGVVALVLAAGMSRRMGETKQLLSLAGKPLLEHTLNHVRQSQVQEIVLVLGHQADEIKQRIALSGTNVVINPDFQQGMGTSLRAGLNAVSKHASAALIVLADQPFVKPATLNRLIECHSAHHPQIAIPLYKGFRGNPVLLDRSVFPELRALNGDIGCRAIFGSHTDGIYKLEVDDPGVLLDVDHRSDLEILSAANHSAAALPDMEERAELIDSSPELVIVGNDRVARALGKLGRILQFSITFVDPFLRIRDLPEADRVLHVLDFRHLRAGDLYVVVASRGRCDEEAIEQAIGSGARYVALLANKNRAGEIIRGLTSHGRSEKELSRIHSPAGLDLGAANDEEIALSILAEIVAERHSKRERG